MKIIIQLNLKCESQIDQYIKSLDKFKNFKDLDILFKN